MCLLTYYSAGAAIDTSALRFGAEANPDGHGFAIVAGDRIITGHGMNAPTVIDAFARTRADHPDGPALFHSRYATRGAIELSNCHPFRLGGDRRTVLAHNGTLPKRVHPRAYDRRSDTRIAAEDYLPTQPFGPIDTAAGARGLAGWLGSSKLVILTVDRAYSHTAYLFGERAGQWVGGIWYSNHSYLPPELRWPARRTTVCGYCLDRDLERTSRYCRDCGWCFGCQSALSYCTCLPTPTRPAPPAGPAST
ncbi:class II glutamine amidotransferase [Nocardia nova]